MESMLLVIWASQLLNEPFSQPIGSGKGFLRQEKVQPQGSVERFSKLNVSDCLGGDPKSSFCIDNFLQISKRFGLNAILVLC